jgi:hypothetical protein
MQVSCSDDNTHSAHPQYSVHAEFA